MPPPWRSGGGIEPRDSVIGGVHVVRTLAQFRQGRDAVGAEKLVSDQQALFPCEDIRNKKYLFVTNIFTWELGLLV